VFLLTCGRDMPSEVARFGDGLELDRGAYELRRVKNNPSNGRGRRAGRRDPSAHVRFKRYQPESSVAVHAVRPI
jgi:hypothetical protein